MSEKDNFSGAGRGHGFCCEGENPFSGLQRGINSLFEQFAHEVPVDKLMAWGNRVSSGLNLGFTPRLDVIEDGQQITVTVELPGMEENQIELAASKDRLVIRGEKKGEIPEEGMRKAISERVFGKFERVVDIKTEIDSERVSASFSKGVLRVVMPKLHPAQERKVSIKVETGE